MAVQQIKYVSPVTIGITLASLASNATYEAYWVGRESNAIDNSSFKYDDVLVTGQVTTGTSPTADNPIRCYVYASFDDAPTYPDVFDGTDSAETILDPVGAMRHAQSILVDGTSNRAYFFQFSVARLYGGIMPRHWGLFLSHSTLVNLHATAGNHFFKYWGITNQVT